MLNWSHGDKLAVIANQKKAERAYWLEQLAETPGGSNFPFDFKKEEHRSPGMQTVNFSLHGELFSSLMQLSNRGDIKLNMILAAGVVVLLSRYTGSSDIMIGSPIYKQQIDGNFMNTVLPLRNRVEDGMTFKQLLLQVRETLNNAVKNQNFPVELLAEALDIPVKEKESPFFDIAVLLRNIHHEKYLGAGRYHMVFAFNRKDNYIDARLEFNPSLYRRETVEQIIRHFSRLLENVAADVDMELSGVDFLSPQEIHRLLVEFNGPRVDFPGDKTFHRLFEDRAEKAPHGVVLTGGENVQVTYRELNLRALRLASQLNGKGVGPGNIVALLAEPSPEMITGILGILTSGGAYLPIEPGYPRERIDYMLADSGAGLILTVGEEGIEITGDGSMSHAGTAGLSNPAYVIYTSGSTGKPRGVLVEHRNLAANLFAFLREFKLTPSDIVVQLTAFVFDAFVEEAFPLLVTGGKIAVPPSGKMRDMEETAAFIRDRGVTVIDCSPLLLNEFNKLDPSYLSSVRYFISGGDVLKPGYIDNLLKTGVVYNTYGPTETTVCVTYYRCVGSVGGASDIPIGKPISNYSVYVLDRGGQLLPPGVPGELCVSGAGVTRGYLNNPELTAERFSRGAAPSLPTPYPLPFTPYYRTGDLVRWLPDGNVEFLGRIDQQVKIRGFRIELGEIESKLLAHEDIDSAVVVQKTDENGNSYLCGYFVSGRSLESAYLRDYLADKLPDYMIPWFFRQLEQFPLTSSGKIDRKSLPEIETGDSVGYIPPRNPMEKELVTLWEEVLAVDAGKIGIDNGFFDLGGNSLKAIILVSMIKKQFNVEISLEDIFNLRTIREISSLIKGSVETGYVSIEKAEKKEYYPATSAQRRLYVMQQVEPGSISYNLPTVIQLDGHVDGSRLEKAFAGLIKRHAGLRTSFEIVEDEPVQKVHDEVDVEVRYIDAGNMDAIGHKETVYRFVQPFYLDRAPLLRVALIDSGAERYILVVDMHHIISDGVSMGVLINEFAALFGGNELPGLRLQYSDYAEWEKRCKGGESIREQESFWLGEYGFPGEIPVLDLPTDYPRPAVRTSAGSTLSFRLDGKDTRELRALASKQGMTLYMVLLSLYFILLYKLSGQEVIVVGTPTAGRRHADLEGIIGMFVNTLALKGSLAGGKTVIEFLKEVKEKTLRAFANQDYQYEELVEKIMGSRDTGRNPLFDTMFILQNQDIPSIEISGLKMKPYRYERDTSKFDLTLECIELEGVLSCNFEYSTKLFKKETIERFLKYYKQIITSVLGNPDSRLSGIDMLTGWEKHQLIVDFNDTANRCPRDKTIYRLFEEQVDCFPDHTALVFKDAVMTFRQLDESADRLAGYLRREEGLGTGDRAAVLMERSFELIVSLMGVMKAGGAYVPLDPALPGERLRVLLNDASVKVVLSQERFREKLVSLMPDCSGLHRVLCADGPGDWMKTSCLPRPGTGGADEPAYVMYTSGSSGTPKGVLVEHRTIVNTLWWRKAFYGYTPGSVSLQNPPYFFDSSVTDIFTPLLGGARLVLIEESERMDLVALRKIITLNRVTHFIAVPAFYNALLEEIGDSLKGVKIICAAGEHFPDELVEKHFGKLPGVRITNEYGPTENSVNTTIYELKPDSPKALIGKPIWNVGVFILDRYRGLCPIGVTGEMCLTGSSLARGYLNNPEMTAQKFNRSYKSYRTYFTGDLGRRLPDGNLEFLGRVDTQVKIRGMRIEIGEIESHLMRHMDIKEAVVLAHEDPAGEKYLCAYVVTPSTLSTGFREYLSQLLPDYMIPSYFVELDRVPLTPSGKIDRQALPVPGVRERREYVPPRDETEKKLVHIWSEILGIEETKIGIDSNFFELGGHSLRATIVASRIHRAFNVNLPLAEIFKTPFIRGLAKYITGARKEQFVALEPAEKREYYVLSPPQKRLYLLQQMDPESVAYNMPQSVTLTGEVDRGRLEWTFRRLIERHESLRTSFHMVSDEPVQTIHDEVVFEIEYIDIRDPRRNLHRVHAFDLARAPLLRGELIKESEDKHTLWIDLHHIISDGTSQAVLKDEFNRLYSGDTEGAGDLPPLRIQYKDYALWWNSELQLDRVKEQESYWLGVFNGEVPVLDLPLDYPRPVVQGFEGNTVNFLLTPGQTRTLNNLVSERNMTLYMALSAIFNILLSKLSGQEDIIVGTPIAGRRHADLESIIGVFINTLPMRDYPAGEKGFDAFLGEVKAQTLGAYENQEYPFEELVDKIDVKRDIGRNPVFDVMLNVMNQEEFTWDMGGLAEHKHEKGTSKFDLTLTVVDPGERLLCTFEYCTGLFKSRTVDRFIGYFRELVDGIGRIGANPGTKLRELDILPEEERRQILYGFNETACDYPRDKTIRQLFETQVERTPDNVALIFEDKKLTYRELNGRSDRLAGVLMGRGMRAGETVGIFLHRCLELMTAVFGILKAGGAYLPLDPNHPPERIKFMLRESRTGTVITDTRLLPGDEFRLVDPFEGEIDENGESNPDALSTPGDPAYVIYTSGTTGVPRGVVIEHRAVCNFIKGMTDIIEFGPGDTVLSLTTISFDIFGLETLVPLSRGCRVVLGNSEEQMDPAAGARVIRGEKVTIFQLTPSRLQLFLSAPGASSCMMLLRYLLVGGEAFPAKLLEEVKPLVRGKIYNLYGPTETTIWSAARDLSDEKALNIGKPIANTCIYILSKNGSVQPVGVAGELCIGGDGLARGYLNRPELTAERFYRTCAFYKTGDLARWLPDGSIDFLGRTDHQVKIRGFRIELEEIEGGLKNYPGIGKAVVVSRQEGERQYLCAYYTEDPGAEPVPVFRLKEHLEGRLPDYMVPSCFVKVEQIPLNSSGKVDRKKLPVPLESDFLSGAVYEAPESTVQQVIAETWKEVLGRERVGIRDNFFDLGGNSMDFVTVGAKLKERLGRDIPVLTLFTYPTIRSLEIYLTGGEEAGTGTAVQEDNSRLIDEGKDLMYLAINKLDNGEQYETQQ